MSDIELQEPRNIVSPRPGKRWDSKAPTVKGDADFDDLLCEVVETVKATEMGHWSEEFLQKDNPTELTGVPELLAKRLRLGTNKYPKPKNLALSVSMDKPWHLGEHLIDELLSRGYKYKVDKPGTAQFCDTDASYMACMVKLNENALKALDRVFDIKYYWKAPRPEDYLKVHGSIFNVDGYSAPGHWRYGAGHGAYSGSTAETVINTFDLPADVEAEVRYACWVFAQGRSFLGVHFHEDNTEGFRVGSQFGN